jgi:hypothetical protein
LIGIFFLAKQINIIALEIADNEVHMAKPKYFMIGTNNNRKITFNTTEHIPNITGDLTSPAAKYREENTFVNT